MPPLRISYTIHVATTMATNITFRTQLLGGVAEFCAACNLGLFGNPINLVEMIVSLARYTEEGVRLIPQVYVTDNIAALTSMLPDGERLKIGDSTADARGIKDALKKTAPLATDGWSIYLQDSNGIEFGVFRGSGNPLSVAIDDILLIGTRPLLVVKIFNVAEACVEIRANNGEYHHVFLDHRKDDSPPPLQYLEKLVSAVVKNSPADSREALASFLKKLLFTALRESHGCLIAVTNMKKIPEFLANDGVLLDTPIDFSEFVRQLKKNEIDSTVLTNKGSLLKGMLNSDGIILFDDKGKLLAYNCFVKVKQDSGVVGGARRRAFAAMQGKVGSGLAAAFMQSQDGWTEFKGVDHV